MNAIVKFQIQHYKLHCQVIKNFMQNVFLSIELLNYYYITPWLFLSNFLKLKKYVIKDFLLNILKEYATLILMFINFLWM